MVGWGIVAFLLLAGGIALWPSRGSHAGYPFARRVAGTLDSSNPLWEMQPATLEKLMVDDVARLERTVARARTAVEHAEKQAKLLETERIEDLDAAGRQAIRDVWWGMLEPLVALDDLKSRYDGWYGVDYTRHPGLHARAYGISFAALCAQVDAGQSLMKMVEGKKLAQSLFDEAMPELGLPAGTFRALQNRLVRSRDYSYVPLGAEWFGEWINPNLQSGPAGQRIATVVASTLAAATRWTQARNASAAVSNKVDVLKDEAFSRWFPVQKKLATWFGDTRVAPENRRLISDAQLADLGKAMKPGDVIVERRNWYLSNVGLPGFWPHAALYSGTQEQIRAAFDGDADVTKAFGGKKLSEHLAATHPAGWRALGEKDHAGHPHTVVEAVSEGVVAASLEHSCGADYVAVLRPRLSPVVIARALDRALGYFGRPYDFNFDFATDDAIVCSELVMKAYEPAPETPGLRVPYITVAGRRAIPPTEIVKVFAAEGDKADRQLDFVYFLEGREADKKAIVADAAALAQSPVRPKWDLAQP